MRVIQVSAKADADGAIRLSIPVGTGGSEYELAVVVSPKAPAADSTRPKTPEELGWPPGYFERTFGSIQDETFMIHPQRGPSSPVPPLDES